MQDDEEAQVREEDQQFEEIIYKPAAGGWKTVLIIGLLLLGVGGIMFAYGSTKEMGALVFLGVICAGAGFVCIICTCRGITCIDPNQAVFITYCTKYIGTMKQNGIFWTHPCY